jgi:hypothetical protein
MSSEVFVLSAVRSTEAAEAVRQAVEAAGVKPARVEDAVFSIEPTHSVTEAIRAVRSAGLTCPAVCISSSLRAVFFAAQSILSGDVELVVVVEAGAGGCIAIVLSAPEPIGRWNLMPRARLAARWLTGGAAALQAAGIAAGEVTVVKDGDSLDLASEVIDELERREAQWGLVTAGELALLVERT